MIYRRFLIQRLDFNVQCMCNVRFYTPHHINTSKKKAQILIKVPKSGSSVSAALLSPDEDVRVFEGGFASGIERNTVNH